MPVNVETRRDYRRDGSRLYYEMRWRQTTDVDLALAIELRDFPGALPERPGWKRHPKTVTTTSPRWTPSCVQHERAYAICAGNSKAASTSLAMK
jgi:hypothetical protein